MNIVELNQKELSTVAGGYAIIVPAVSGTVLGIVAATGTCGITFYKFYGKKMTKKENLYNLLLCITAGAGVGGLGSIIAFNTFSSSLSSPVTMQPL